jgi:hypothetical protein
VGDPSRWPRDTPLSTKVGIKISPTSGGRSVGIVGLRNKGHGVCLFFHGNYLKIFALSLVRGALFEDRKVL